MITEVPVNAKIAVQRFFIPSVTEGSKPLTPSKNGCMAFQKSERLFPIDTKLPPTTPPINPPTKLPKAVPKEFISGIVLSTNVCIFGHIATNAPIPVINLSIPAIKTANTPIPINANSPTAPTPDNTTNAADIANNKTLNATAFGIAS